MGDKMSPKQSASKSKSHLATSERHGGPLARPAARRPPPTPSERLLQSGLAHQSRARSLLPSLDCARPPLLFLCLRARACSQKGHVQVGDNSRRQLLFAKICLVRAASKPTCCSPFCSRSLARSLARPLAQARRRAQATGRRDNRRSRSHIHSQRQQQQHEPPLIMVTKLAQT